MIGSVIDRFPEEVMENFTHKVADIASELRRHAEEIQLFGEAYDGGLDDKGGE